MTVGSTRPGLLLSLSIAAAATVAGANAQPADEGAASDDALPLTPARRIAFDVDEGTWLSLDVSPDDRRVIFELLGDLYTVAIDGGEAERLTGGLAFDAQPTYSPDGQRIAFVSDRSGSENLWIAAADGSAPRRLSDDHDKTAYASPAWSADGRAVFVSRRTESAGVFEIWMFDLAGGSGVRITEGSSGPEQRRAERLNALGAVASPDGRYLYYARKPGDQWDHEDRPSWSIIRHDLESGEAVPVIDGPASALRPQLSPDGGRLVYGARHDTGNGLRLRDLASGEDRWLVFPVERDNQDGGYSRDTLPRYDFTSDGGSLLVSIGGRIRRVELASGRSEPVPFEARVDLEIGPYLGGPLPAEEGSVRARIIQAPRQSPDGRRLAFSALSRLYVMDLPDGTPRRLTEGAAAAEFQPAWSPDGRWIAYVTWDAVDGGHLWRARSDGRGRAERLSRSAGFYTDPVYSPDGAHIYLLHSSHYDRLHRQEEVSPSRIADLIRLPAGGGEASLVAHAGVGARRPYFTAEPGRIYFTTAEGVVALRADGSDRQVQLAVEGPYPWNHRHEKPVPVKDVMLSPDGRWALTRAANQLHLIAVPPRSGEAPRVDLMSQAAGPRRRLTDIGADYFAWADGGATITWSLGATFHRAAFDAKGDVGKLEAIDVVVEVPRDVPAGSLLLRGATAITMRGDELIDDADVLVTANRIAAIGPRGAIDVPADAVIRDVAGRYIVPGFVDTHAHWYEVRRDVLDLQNWSFLINLAFGVTAGLDVQAMDQDMFAYQDLIDAGLMIGPRAWSVGLGMFSDNRVQDAQDARDLLLRYRDYYRTRNVKSYLIGNRRQRQLVVEAAAELGMQPTTEGMSDPKLDITHAVDGFAGNEHYLAALPLYRDVIELFGRSRIGYTPTLLVTSGGPAADDHFFTRGGWHDDAKVRRFMPHFVADLRTSPRQWLREEEHIYPQIAADARRIMQAGGRVGIGSHAQLQGMAYHWEMQAYAAGGWAPAEILRAATAAGADIIGRAAEVGSLEPGKYADLLILERDPLEDIGNTLSIRQVMKNGRLYDADTLDELWPRQRALPPLWFWQDAPDARAGASSTE